MNASSLVTVSRSGCRQIFRNSCKGAQHSASQPTGAGGPCAFNHPFIRALLHYQAWTLGRLAPPAEEDPEVGLFKIAGARPAGARCRKSQAYPSAAILFQHRDRVRSER